MVGWLGASTKYVFYIELVFCSPWKDLLIPSVTYFNCFSMLPGSHNLLMS